VYTHDWGNILLFVSLFVRIDCRRLPRTHPTVGDIIIWYGVAIGGGFSFGLDPVRVRRRCRFSTLNDIDIGPANYGAIRIGLYTAEERLAAVARWLVVPYILLPPQLPLIIIIIIIIIMIYTYTICIVVVAQLHV